MAYTSSVGSSGPYFPQYAFDLGTEDLDAEEEAFASAMRALICP